MWRAKGRLAGGEYAMNLQLVLCAALDLHGYQVSAACSSSVPRALCFVSSLHPGDQRWLLRPEKDYGRCGSNRDVLERDRGGVWSCYKSDAEQQGPVHRELPTVCWECNGVGNGQAWGMAVVLPAG